MIPSCHPDPINLYPETPCNPHRALTYSVTPQETVLVRHFTRSTFVCHTELFLPVVLSSSHRTTALLDCVGRAREPHIYICSSARRAATGAATPPSQPDPMSIYLA
jgi:hypothetical protein